MDEPAQFRSSCGECIADFDEMIRTDNDAHCRGDPAQEIWNRQNNLVIVKCMIKSVFNRQPDSY